MTSKRILVANGPNLDLLGTREVDIYSNQSLSDIEQQLKADASWLQRQFGTSLKLEFFQTNHEGLLLDTITSEWDGIVLNPGAWTHTSLALADRLSAVKVPYVEIHISNVYDREPIRQRSLTAPHATGVICGLGPNGYSVALHGLLTAIC